MQLVFVIVSLLENYPKITWSVSFMFGVLVDIFLREDVHFLW